MALNAVSNQLVLPWWRWPLAGLLGILLGAASLNYSADGRLNVLLLWLLWAGLPLVGSLLALGLMLRPGRPWLARFSQQPLYWQPQRHQQWWLLGQLNWLWCWFGLGIGLVFLLLLLLSDLAFGWSSTLLLEQTAVFQLTQWLSWPWHSLWPAAVPDAALIEQSRFARIEQQSVLLAQTSGWWPFLAMSLLCYNLLPRLALALFCQWQSRRSQPQLQIQQASLASSPKAEPAAELTTTSLAQWQQASLLHWQLPASEAALTLGQHDWQQDNDAFCALLATKPKQLLWRVPASRSPVAELADWMALARKQGIAQALWLQKDDSNARHSASWQAFARAEQLAWLEENA